MRSKARGLFFDFLGGIIEGIASSGSPFSHSLDRAMTIEKREQYNEKKLILRYKIKDFTNHIPVTDDLSDEEAYDLIMKNKKRLIYNAWGGFNSLPEFNTFNEQYKDYIFNINKKMDVWT